MPLNRAQIFKRLGTFYVQKQEIQVETGAFVRSSAMQTSDDFVRCAGTCPCLPFASLRIPNIVLRDL